jgi:uncharacterized protein (TIGR02001 family)
MATALGISTMAMTPSIASAEVSYGLAVSNMYFWRGLDISGVPQVSGNIDYDFGNGFSVGTWASSESNGNQEVDLYGSYAGSVGDFGYSVGYAAYYYPQNTASLSDSDVTEWIVGLSFKDLSLTAYINAQNESEGDNYKYYSLDYSIGKVGLHYGMSTQDTASKEYTDVNVSYALTDNLTWTISKASGDKVDANPALKDPLVVLSYSVPLK